MNSVAAGKKRKTLDDFFATDASVGPIKHPVLSQPYLNTEQQLIRTFNTPPGLSLINAFITLAEEQALLDFLDSQTWRTDLQRRTMHYGGSYCLMPPRSASPGTRKKIEETIITAPSMPAELDFIVQRMIEHGLYQADNEPKFCIVNEYCPGQGISAHVENFRFDEPVCSLTLAGADGMRFHELVAANDGSVRSGKASVAPRTGRRQDVHLDRRSLVILTGDARSKWQHEIARGRKTGKSPSWRRVSLTFRVEKKAGRGRSD